MQPYLFWETLAMVLLTNFNSIRWLSRVMESKFASDIGAYDIYVFLEDLYGA